MTRRSVASQHDPQLSVGDSYRLADLLAPEIDGSGLGGRASFRQRDDYFAAETTLLPEPQKCALTTWILREGRDGHALAGKRKT